MRTAAPLLAGVALLLSVAVARAAPEAPASEPARLKLDAREFSLGRSDAPVTLVEFTDYQCPFCRRFQAETFPLIKKNYIDTGKVRFIVRDLPLEFHSSARPAAEAAHCAAEQGKFWEMHEALLSGADPLANGGIDKRAKAVGLDLTRLHECMRGARYEAAIAANAAAADSLGLNGTPAFVLGRVENGVLVGEVGAGAQPYVAFDEAIKELLAAR
ncbi:MAG TPA: thioredoxin domain-containing protein [Steroidobacteraceae bacterium]|jgi:protein-disulfide isomerase|nr:thioredoxin domain-containing protein [Steroidobacteraceae bacterium]